MAISRTSESTHGFIKMGNYIWSAQPDDESVVAYGSSPEEQLLHTDGEYVDISEIEDRIRVLFGKYHDIPDGQHAFPTFHTLHEMIRVFSRLVVTKEGINAGELTPVEFGQLLHYMLCVAESSGDEDTACEALSFIVEIARSSATITSVVSIPNLVPRLMKLLTDEKSVDKNTIVLYVFVWVAAQPAPAKQMCTYPEIIDRLHAYVGAALEEYTKGTPEQITASYLVLVRIAQNCEEYIVTNEMCDQLLRDFKQKSGAHIVQITNMMFSAMMNNKGSLDCISKKAKEFQTAIKERISELKKKKKNAEHLKTVIDLLDEMNKRLST